MWDGYAFAGWMKYKLLNFIKFWFDFGCFVFISNIYSKESDILTFYYIL